MKSTKTASLIFLSAVISVVSIAVSTTVWAQTANHPATPHGERGDIRGVASDKARTLSAREAPLVRSIESDEAAAGARRIIGAGYYSKYCLSCHGEKGDGKGTKSTELTASPPDFTIPSAVTAMSQSSMLLAINGGHKNAVADAWQGKIDPNSAENLIAFIQDSFMRPAATAKVGSGRRIFARSCSVCHGEKGDSASWAKNSLKPSPFDFTSYKAKRLSRRHMINTVAYGSTGTAMVGFATQLNRAEITAVVDYIRRSFIFPDQRLSSQNQETQVARAPDSEKNPHQSDDGHGDAHDGNVANMDLPFPHDLAGNLTRGKKLFEQNCVACHGKTGQGDGPRAYFIFPRPENFSSKRAVAELNRPHLFKSVSDGVMQTVMPSWNKVLDNQQIADVSEYVFDTFIMPGTDNGENGGAKKK